MEIFGTWIFGAMEIPKGSSASRKTFSSLMVKLQFVLIADNFLSFPGRIIKNVNDKKNSIIVQSKNYSNKENVSENARENL